MNFDSFGYRGNFVFTQPLLLQSQNEKLFVAATPYGNSLELEECLSEFLNEFEGQSEDFDATSPYPKLTCLNSQENLLYTSVQFLNDFIYSNHNRDTLNLACDFFCIYKEENTLYFAQIGWPLVVLHKDKKNIPVSSEYSFAPKNKNSSPFIPTQLLGVESSVNIKIQQININDESEILLLKSNEPPDTLLSTYPNPLKSIANIFAEENPEQGFWLGRLKL